MKKVKDLFFENPFSIVAKEDGVVPAGEKIHLKGENITIIHEEL